MRHVCIITFGCQMNKLDSELAAESARNAGHAIVDDPEQADVLVMNTCAVRDHAEQRILSRLAQLGERKKRQPELIVGLMGCFAEREGDDLLKSQVNLDFVLGTRQFHRLGEIINDSGAMLGGDYSAELEGSGERSLHQGSRAFVSAMRGCDNFCSYCVVPYVRGREMSRPVRDIVEEVRSVTARGAREVTLLGQNIDAYGKADGSSLAELLRTVTEEVTEKDGLRRLRFVTSHPRDISPELVKAVAELPRVAKHFHMPAQSGSDRILAAMRRGYDRRQYDEKLDMIRRLAPEALVASDFIVGYPGETDADFAATLDLIEKADFQNCYIFKYSPRPGTRAYGENDDVPDEVKKERNQILLRAQEKTGRRRAAALTGTVQRVMVEGVSPRDKAKWTGRTSSNLICVFSPSGDELSPGDMVDLKISHGTPLTLFGQPDTLIE